jgi:hypothetical protein
LKPGEKISNLENASFNLTHLLLTILQKVLEKNLQKILQNKTSGANVVQYVKNKETIHAHYVSILAQFQATFALTLCKLVQLCTFIFALVCVGINHQKGGD